MFKRGGGLQRQQMDAFPRVQRFGGHACSAGGRGGTRLIARTAVEGAQTDATAVIAMKCLPGSRHDNRKGRRCVFGAGAGSRAKRVHTGGKVYQKGCEGPSL